MKCPRCGADVVYTTSSGPGEATVAPCGCSVAPGLLPSDGGAA